MIISESLFSGLIFVCALRCSSENYGTGELRNLPAHGCTLESSSSHILMRSFAMGNMGDTIMSFAKTPSGPAEIERSQAMEAFRPLPRGITAFRRAKPIDGEATPESLNSLLGKVSETSMHGIDSLINELAHTARQVTERQRSHSTRHCEICSTERAGDANDKNYRRQRAQASGYSRRIRVSLAPTAASRA